MSVFDVGDVVRSAYLPPFGDFRVLLGPAVAGTDELGKARDGETVCRVETSGTTLVEEGLSTTALGTGPCRPGSGFSADKTGKAGVVTSPQRGP